MLRGVSQQLKNMYLRDPSKGELKVFKLFDASIGEIEAIKAIKTSIEALDKQNPNPEYAYAMSHLEKAVWRLKRIKD